MCLRLLSWSVMCSWSWSLSRIMTPKSISGLDTYDQLNGLRSCDLGAHSTVRRCKCQGGPVHFQNWHIPPCNTLSLMGEYIHKRHRVLWVALLSLCCLLCVSYTNILRRRLSEPPDWPIDVTTESLWTKNFTKLRSIRWEKPILIVWQF